GDAGMALVVRCRIVGRRDCLERTAATAGVATLVGVGGPHPGGGADRGSLGKRGVSSVRFTCSRCRRKDCGSRSFPVSDSFLPAVPPSDVDAVCISDFPDRGLL